jgi:2-oxoglutarate ferredoxin oxidoreductase subunit delta
LATAKAKKVARIEIDPTKCTGCGICVEFCSRGVLVLEEGCAAVVALEKCTLCRLCELRCPEPAILVTASE